MVHAPSRPEATAKMCAALAQTQVKGVMTNLEFLRVIAASGAPGGALDGGTGGWGRGAQGACRGRGRREGESTCARAGEREMGSLGLPGMLRAALNAHSVTAPTSLPSACCLPQRRTPLAIPPPSLWRKSTMRPTRVRLTCLGRGVAGCSRLRAALQHAAAEVTRAALGCHAWRAHQDITADPLLPHPVHPRPYRLMQSRCWMRGCRPQCRTTPAASRCGRWACRPRVRVAAGGEGLGLPRRAARACSS